MMNETNIDQLKNILSKTSFGERASNINADDQFKDAGVDSLDLLDFYFNLEEHFSIQIPDEDVTELTSLAKTREYLLKKLDEV